MQTADEVIFSPISEDLWDRLRDETRPIVVYGMGNGADKLLSRLEEYGVRPTDIFASDGFVRGHSFHGFRVRSFREICDTYPDFVVLLSFASRLPSVLELLRQMDRSHTLIIPDMPVVGTTYFDRRFYQEHRSELEAAYRLLADARSRALFCDIVRYKLQGGLADLDRAVYRTSPFDPRSIRTYVDLGAYNGDTAKAAIARFPCLKTILAVEPDDRNYRKLSQFAQGAVAGVEILPIRAAAWSSQGKRMFFKSGNRNASLLNASHERDRVEVDLITVDAIAEGREVDCIKMDVEGAEREALCGARQTIRRCRPVLFVSAYHRSEDLFDLLLYLDEICTDYRFYLCRNECVPAWEIDIVAVPFEREVKK